MTGSSLPRRGPSLRIVSVNDVYTLENLPRLRSLVEHHRTTDPADRLLVMLAGDFVAPSLLSSLDAGRGMVDVMKRVGVTHACFGNHEDDIPMEALRKRVNELGAVFVSTNLAFEPELPTHDIVEVGRVRVGIVGVVMDDLSAYRGRPFGGARLSPPNQAARAEADRLVRRHGCTATIAMTHQSLDDDRALAHAQEPLPFSVIVGGHEHVVVVERVEQTWIVKAGSDAVHAAVIDLRWPEAEPRDPGMDRPTVSVRIEDVAAYPDDRELRALVEEHMGAVHELETATLLKIEPGAELSSIGARERQTSLGAMLCSVVGRALGAEGCLINGGGIRGARTYRDRLTFGDLKTELPFDNEIVVAPLPGRVLRDAIRASRAHAPIESGSYLQVDDKICVDARGEVTSVAGAPLETERTYAVALVRELLVGLDRIEPLVAWAEAHPEAVPPPGCGRETKLIVVDALAASLWREMGGFDAVDADGDGVVTEAEIMAALARITAEKASRITANLVIRALDKNNDSVVTRDEAAVHEQGLAGQGKAPDTSSTE